MNNYNGGGEGFSAKMRKNLAKQQQMVDEWNAKVKIGDPVDFFEREGGHAQRFTTMSKAEVMSSHTAIVWLNGKSGCVALRACVAVAPEPVGVYMGLCNRGACRAPGANWFNHSTLSHYCGTCAAEINKFDEQAGDGKRLYGHALCTLVPAKQLAHADDHEGATLD